jgi:hypothetical protein
VHKPDRTGLDAWDYEQGTPFQEIKFKGPDLEIKGEAGAGIRIIPRAYIGLGGLRLVQAELAPFAQVSAKAEVAPDQVTAGLVGPVHVTDMSLKTGIDFNLKTQFKQAIIGFSLDIENTWFKTILFEKDWVSFPRITMGVQCRDEHPIPNLVRASVVCNLIDGESMPISKNAAWRHEGKSAGVRGQGSGTHYNLNIDSGSLSSLQDDVIYCVSSIKGLPLIKLYNKTSAQDIQAIMACEPGEDIEEKIRQITTGDSICFLDESDSQNCLGSLPTFSNLTGVYDAIIIPTMYHNCGVSYNDDGSMVSDSSIDLSICTGFSSNPFLGWISQYNSYRRPEYEQYRYEYQYQYDSWDACNPFYRGCCPSLVAYSIYSFDPLVDLLQISHQLEDSYFAYSNIIMEELAHIYDMLRSLYHPCDYEFPCSDEQQDECSDMYVALLLECSEMEEFKGEDEILYCENYLSHKLYNSINQQLGPDPQFDSHISFIDYYLWDGITRDRVKSLAQILPMNKFFNYSGFEGFYRETFDPRCYALGPEEGSRIYHRYIDERTFLYMDRGKYIAPLHLEAFRYSARSAMEFWEDSIREDRFNKIAPLWVDELTTELLGFKNALLSWDCPETEEPDWLNIDWENYNYNYNIACTTFHIGQKYNYAGIFLRERYIERINTVLDLLPVLLEGMSVLSNYFEIFSMVNNGIVSYAEGGLDFMNSTCYSQVSTCPCGEINATFSGCPLYNGFCYFSFSDCLEAYGCGEPLDWRAH